MFVEAVTGRVWRCPPSQAVGRFCLPCLADPAGFPTACPNAWSPTSSPIRQVRQDPSNVERIPFTNRDNRGLALPAIQVRCSRFRGTVQ